MSEDVLRKAFEPFFTTKPVGSGTGLGLSQVYGIAKQTGGTVTISTKIGRGTNITVYLPRTAGGQIERRIERVQPGTIASTEPPSSWTMTAMSRQLAVSCLELLGYRTLAADGGKAAVEAIRNTRVDMVLIDIAMPEINGVEALATMLKKRPDLPYLYMTGYVGATTLDPSEQQVLKKPFTVAELAAKVEQVLFPTERRQQESNNVFPIKPGSRN